MTESAWTWFLFAMEVVGIVGMLLVGRRLWWGWIVVMLHSIPWGVYAVVRHRGGFIAMACMWWTVHAYNARRWLTGQRAQSLVEPRP